MCQHIIQFTNYTDAKILAEAIAASSLLGILHMPYETSKNTVHKVVQRIRT